MQVRSLRNLHWRNRSVIPLSSQYACMLCSSRLEYCDEAVRDPASQNAIPVDIHQPPAFLHKILQLNSLQLFYDSSGTEQVMEFAYLTYY